MNAQQRIAYTESRQTYRKVGRKYVPIDDPFACTGLAPGWWLVKVSDGCTSVRATIHPHRAEIDVAFKDAVYIVQRIISDAVIGRPNKVQLTEDQAADWNALIAKHGETFRMLEFKSIVEIAEEIVEKVTNMEVQP